MGTGHFYMTMHGEFTGAWVGEFAQMGIRIGCWPIGTSGGPVRALHDLGAPTQTYNTYDVTNFNVVQNFEQDLPGAPASFSEYCDDLALDAYTFLNSIKAQQATLFRWTHLKIAPVELGTGKTRVPASLYTLKSPIIGSAAGMTPPEVSIAMSLRAPIVGRRGRGRMYLPGIANNTIGSDGKIAAATRTTMAGVVKTFVDSLGNTPGVDTTQTRVIITSAPSVDCVFPSEVRVGDHADAQRRRQHQVDEVYSVTALA